jgi:dihydropteroate synthase
MNKIPKIAGILNITPDSFSDGGLCGNNAEILNVAQRLIADGADLLDVGAESTRPNAMQLSHEEEWARLQEVLPQICELAKIAGVLTSVDTRHAQTAKLAIDCGIDWVNDVSGAEHPHMLDVLKNWPGRVVIMHNMGVPADKNITIPEHEDAVFEVSKWLAARLDLLEGHGIVRRRVIIDPGIGFGKSAAQSWQLIDNIDKLQLLGAEVLVGHSRKSFLNQLCSGQDCKVSEKDAATLDVSIKLAARGVDYLRVHNVVLHKATLLHPK